MFYPKKLTIFALILFVLVLLSAPKTTSSDDILSAVKQPNSPLETFDRKKVEHSKEKHQKDHHHDDDDDDDEKRNANKKKKSDIESAIKNVGFIHAFFASISVILVSEIGDKTFFIAAIMSMKHPRLTVYSGAISALGLMTLLSALLGNILTQFIPRTYTYYASSFLFALFGLKMLREGYGMSHTDANEEYEEASSTLRETEEKAENKHDKNLEIGGESSSGINTFYKYKNLCLKYVSTVFLQSFVLTFLAELGDRSQISTIILGARENMFGTVLGGTIGHAICTGAAVIGGRMVAQRISVKTVTLVGACVFLFFAFSAFFIDPEEY